MQDSEHEEWLQDRKAQKKAKKAPVPIPDDDRPARKNHERDDDDSFLNQTSSHPY